MQHVLVHIFTQYMVRMKIQTFLVYITHSKQVEKNKTILIILVGHTVYLHCEVVVFIFSVSLDLDLLGQLSTLWSRYS